MYKLAPIIFVCYNRYSHIMKSLKSLKSNKLSKNSNIYIFSDGPKNKQDEKKILKIRKFLKKLKGFKSKKIILRKKNYGTKKNITKAVNQVFTKYDKVIVVEDDLIVIKSFLFFMNSCLNYYKNNKKIWHINGWSYPFMKMSNDDINFLKSMNCWGWATWKNKWKNISLIEEKYMKLFSKKDIHNFNIKSTMEHWSQIIRNKNKVLSSWAVFWHATIFLNGGICIYPKFSLVKNLGFDGSGRMSVRHKYDVVLKHQFQNFQFNDQITLNNNLMNKEFHYYLQKKSILGKLLVYFKKFYFKVC